MHPLWNFEKQFVADDEAFLSNRDYLSKIIDLLCEVILPRIENSDKDSKNIILNIYNEMKEKNFELNAIIPLKQLFDYADIETSEKTILSGINSSIRDICFESLNGLILWYMYSKAKLMLPPSENFLLEVINRIISKKQPHLDLRVEFINNLKLGTKADIHLKNFHTMP